MVYKGLIGYRDDYVEHIKNGRCTCTYNQPVPCVAICPAHVDIPGYVALVEEGRYADAIRLIRKTTRSQRPAVLSVSIPARRDAGETWSTMRSISGD